MKRIFLASVILMVTFCSVHASSFVSGSTGVDGAFNPAANTELQLPADGVFNFTTVNIPAGVTVTFKKNAANTPAYILATGDVIIAGTINVNGGSATSLLPGTGGPGGFDGGYIGSVNTPGGRGMGPGGGEPSAGPCGTYNWHNDGGSGSFGTQGRSTSGCAAAGAVYGNMRLIPLIGGSGGGGAAGYNTTEGGTGNGGGGGGALLLASSGEITITGAITANGGNSSSRNRAGAGSGGAIKLMANVIRGNGTIAAAGGFINVGGQGRIRIEANVNTRTAGTDPPYSFGRPGSVFPANAPMLRITSIAGANVPANPTGAYNQPDIMLPGTTTNPVSVTLSASNIPVGATVTVSVIPQYGGATNVNTTLSGTQASSTASASVNLSTQYSNVIVAQATFTIQTAMYYEGEKIDRVRVAAAIGGESETIYISESGKEIPAKELQLAGLIR